MSNHGGLRPGAGRPSNVEVAVRQPNGGCFITQFFVAGRNMNPPTANEDEDDGTDSDDTQPQLTAEEMQAAREAEEERARVAKIEREKAVRQKVIDQLKLFSRSRAGTDSDRWRAHGHRNRRALIESACAQSDQEQRAPRQPNAQKEKIYSPAVRRVCVAVGD